MPIFSSKTVITEYWCLLKQMIWKFQNLVYSILQQLCIEKFCDSTATSSAILHPFCTVHSGAKLVKFVQKVWFMTQSSTRQIFAKLHNTFWPRTKYANSQGHQSYTQFPLIRNAVKYWLVAFLRFSYFLYQLCFLTFWFYTVSVS